MKLSLPARYLSAREIDLILGAFTDRVAARDQFIFLCRIRCGMTITEILSLRIDDVFDGEGIRAEVKIRRRYQGYSQPRLGETVDTFLLPEEVRRVAQDWVRCIQHTHPGGSLSRWPRSQRPPWSASWPLCVKLPLWSGRNRAVMCRAAAWKKFGRACRQALGRHVTLADLKMTYMVNLIRSGVTVPEAMKRLRISRPENMVAYMALLIEHQKKLLIDVKVDLSLSLERLKEGI